ncbi:MAG: peroxiredoxin family protein [Rhodospirillaceae bacterium]
MRALVLALTVLLGFSGTAARAESIDIGPAVGTAIPMPFAVHDSQGALQTFADLAGPSGAVLVFVRSASWCPYCIQQLRDIESVNAELKTRGYRLVSVSYDTPDILTAFAKKFGVTYTMTSDEGSKMIDAFKIRDPQYPATSRAYGVPKPAIFVVDKGGIVRAKLAEEGYKTRPPSAAIISAIDSLKK